MRKRTKKMTACILTALLGLSIMNFPVHAQETQANQQVENNSVLIQNMESLFIGQSLFKTAVQALTATEPNNAGSFYVEGDPDGWTYDAGNKTLTFTKDGNYKVTGDGNQTDIQIVVSKITTTLTVKDVTCYQPQYRSGMSIDGEANVTLVLEGKNEFVADESSSEAGIQFEMSKNGKLTIEGKGSLVATGDHQAAGIGGGYNGLGNNITINSGTITATGNGGAGIGGGSSGTANNITINGGTIIAIGESYASNNSGAGIGGGRGEGGTNITINGGTVTASSSLGDGIGDGDGGSGSKNIKITGGSVKATGKEAISATPIDGNGNPVYLAKLDIADNVNQIKVDGKDYQIEGKHENDTNYYLYMTAGEHYVETESNVYKSTWDDVNKTFNAITTPIETGDLKVTGGSYGIDYIYDSSADTLTFKTNGNYTVTGNGQETKEQIVVDAGLTMNLTVKDVKCHPTTGAGMSIDGSSTVTLILEGNNEFVSDSDNNAGIEFNNATGSLTIKGSGSLTATGGQYGAGIGGGNRYSGKNIYVTGGKIVATGGFYAAGIGGGQSGSGENITINNGIIYSAGNYGAGIGGGYLKGGINITINGGTITASSKGGAAIGTGDGYANTSNIKITGGKVIANGGSAGIGAAEGSGRYITISGGEVIATGAAGIGSGGSSSAGSGENITISGGTVTAKGRKIDIGGSDSYFAKNIIISGGSVNAKTFNIRPTNDAGVNVYCAKLDNQSGVNKVTVDGNIVTRNGDHPDGDTAFYLFLTGEDHIITVNQNHYKAIWNGYSTFIVKQIPPIPTNITTTQTASTITVTEPADAATYGGVMYSKDNQTWQTSNIFKNLDSSKDYIIYVKYKGNDTYIESEVAQKTVKTSPATYTITIPSTTLTAGNEASTNEIKVSSMDIGYQDEVNVKILGNGNVSNNGILTLTRQGASNIITSALFVNGMAFTDINNNIATFTNSDKNPVSISFAKPTQTNIPAGTYNGTVTFEVTYTQ